MAIVYKLIPQLLCWCGIVLVLARGFRDRRTVAATAGCAGFGVGVVAASLLFRAFPGDLSFGIIRDALGSGLLLFWGVAVAAVYRSTIRNSSLVYGGRLAAAPVAAWSFLAGVMAGAICACRLTGAESRVAFYLLMVVAAGALACAALVAERYLPDSFTLPGSALTATVVSLLLLGSSLILRLDLFSLLTMKVMRFAHDFVHQFMESMLIPDHLFFSPKAWNYIGFLFGKEIGFWGALIAWFTPAILVILAVRLERLPPVAHIRQGAQRRRLVASAIRARRLRLVIPVIAVVVLAAAVYRSRFPNVEYWDPKPVTVSASPAGEISIPKKGEIDLEDGKLHKYLFKQGGKEARFFVLMTPDGRLTVDLDACAICKPDGYGQSEGTVICYYCLTLIPLETVGKPGGCNPVPVPFTEKEDKVIIDGLTLINSWGNTVQSTSRIKEGGK